MCHLVEKQKTLWRVRFMLLFYVDLSEDAAISKYTLKDYVYGEKRKILLEGVEYELQLFEGDHSGEYVLSELKDGKAHGRCQLFDHGVISLAWIVEDGKRVGNITEYENGKVLFKQNWGSIISNDERRFIENSKDGLVLTITVKSESDGSDIEIFRGNFDVDMNRNGYGLEYDRKTGKEKIEGYWEKDKLVRIIREFDTNKGRMYEYSECENVEIWNRIPVYIGGYCLKNGMFVRHGKGYLIDESSGAATRESEWEYGKEKEGIAMYEGWYYKRMNESIRTVLRNKKPEEASCLPEDIQAIPEKKSTVTEVEKNTPPEVKKSSPPEVKKSSPPEVKKNTPPEVKKNTSFEEQLASGKIDLSQLFPNGVQELVDSIIKEKTGKPQTEAPKPVDEEPLYDDLEITNFQISSDRYNEMTELDFSKFTNLVSIEIGDNCFASVKVFLIDGLSQLKSVKIGQNSFCQSDDPDTSDKSKSFHIINCKSLESIEIGKSSFSDFGGQFELKNLDSLQTIKIGSVGSKSYNFTSCSFVVQGLHSVRF